MSAVGGTTPAGSTQAAERDAQPALLRSPPVAFCRPSPAPFSSDGRCLASPADRPACAVPGACRGAASAAAGQRRRRGAKRSDGGAAGRPRRGGRAGQVRRAASACGSAPTPPRPARRLSATAGAAAGPAPGRPRKPRPRPAECPRPPPCPHPPAPRPVASRARSRPAAARPGRSATGPGTMSCSAARPIFRTPPGGCSKTARELPQFLQLQTCRPR